MSPLAIILALLALPVAALLALVFYQERKMSREAIIGNALKAKVKELTTANADLTTQLATAQANAKDGDDLAFEAATNDDGSDVAPAVTDAATGAA